MVTFHPIQGFPGYRIGNDGSLWTRKFYGFWRKMKTRKHKQGYHEARLSRDGRCHIIRVHKLVLEAFVGPCPKGLEACHKDDNKDDNSLQNLRWGTRESNIEDAKANGRILIGTNHRMVKLNERQIHRIRRNPKLHRYGWAPKMGRKYGVSASLIRQIVNRQIWRHV